MVKAIRVHEHGGPEVMKWEDVEIGDPKEGEIRVKLKAIGVNYLDVYIRKGISNRTSLAPLPFTPGVEGAGVVTAISHGVMSCKVGDVVACIGFPMGSYAEEWILPADRAIPVPSSIDPIIAAAIIFKGLTAEVLVRRCFKLERGHTILVHAAAGGVGSLLCQWANALGALVIGTVSTKEKAEQAREDGCHHVILYKEENFVDCVNKITSGKGVDVVYDSIGKATLEGSLACLKERGLMAVYGMVSGEPGPLQFSQIANKAIFFTVPSVIRYTTAQDELLEAAKEVYANITKGVLRVRVNHKYYLSQAAQAHIDLESRKTSGSIVLIPDEVLE